MFLSICRSFFVEADDCRPCSARLSVQSTQIWMMKPLAQMAWAVGKMPFEWNSNAFRKSWPFQALVLCDYLDDPPKNPSIDDETPCLNGIGSRDMPFDWNINALRHYIPQLAGLQQAQDIACSSWLLASGKAWTTTRPHQQPMMVIGE